LLRLLVAAHRCSSGSQQIGVEQSSRHKVKQRCPVLSSIVAVELRNEQLAALRHDSDAARQRLVVGVGRNKERISLLCTGATAMNLNC
jgi:hypothetical protein